jgi:hypothetical protein
LIVRPGQLSTWGRPTRMRGNSVPRPENLRAGGGSRRVCSRGLGLILINVDPATPGWRRELRWMERRSHSASHAWRRWHSGSRQPFRAPSRRCDRAGRHYRRNCGVRPPRLPDRDRHALRLDVDQLAFLPASVGLLCVAAGLFLRIETTLRKSRPLCQFGHALMRDRCAAAHVRRKRDFASPLRSFTTFEKTWNSSTAPCGSSLTPRCLMAKPCRTRLLRKSLRAQSSRQEHAQRRRLDRPPAGHRKPRRFHRALLRTHSGAFTFRRLHRFSDRRGRPRLHLKPASAQAIGTRAPRPRYQCREIRSAVDRPR